MENLPLMEYKAKPCPFKNTQSEAANLSECARFPDTAQMLCLYSFLVLKAIARPMALQASTFQSSIPQGEGKQVPGWLLRPTGETSLGDSIRDSDIHPWNMQSKKK